MEVIEKVKTMLEAGSSVKDGDWEPKAVEVLNKYLFLTAKPVIYLANIGKEQYVKK